MTLEFFTRTVTGSDQNYNHLIREMNEMITTAGYYQFITKHTGFYVGGGFLHGPSFYKGKSESWVYNEYGPLAPTLTFGAYFRINNWRFMTGFDYLFFIDDDTRKGTFTLSVGGII